MDRKSRSGFHTCWWCSILVVEEATYHISVDLWSRICSDGGGSKGDCVDILTVKGIDQLSYCPCPCKILCDNIGVISWFKDEIVAESSKHVQVRYFYVKNYVSKSILDYVYVPSSENVADMLTKGLNRIKTQYFTKAMGLVETMTKGKCWDKCHVGMITSFYNQTWYNCLRFSSVFPRPPRFFFYLSMCCKWLCKMVRYRVYKTNLRESIKYQNPNLCNDIFQQSLFVEYKFIDNN